MPIDYNKEGEIINGILHTRVVKNNKNMLIVVTGPTGSGKSFVCLRVAELWYRKRFKKEFPKENICFSLDEIMSRLATGNLVSGDMLILEEAGTSMGNMDFQNKASKMFNYILQTFRSRNIIVLMNLPYFTMLNKTTRMLLHMRWEMMSIDKTRKVSYIKPYWIQVSQTKGKTYYHFPQILVNRSTEQVRFLSYGMPSKELHDRYEERKASFVMGLTNDIMQVVANEKLKAANAMRPTKLVGEQQRVYDFIMANQNKYRTLEIAQQLGMQPANLTQKLNAIEKRGFFLRNYIIGGQSHSLYKSPMPLLLNDSNLDKKMEKNPVVVPKSDTNVVPKEIVVPKSSSGSGAGGEDEGL